VPAGTLVLSGVGAAVDARVWIWLGSAGSGVDGDLLKGGRLDEEVPAEEIGFLGAYEGLRRTRRPPEADQPDSGEFAQVVRAAAYDPVRLEDFVLGAGPDDAAVVDEGQVVADAVQVGGDVRGEQDAVSLVKEKVADNAGELVPGGRVQAAIMSFTAMPRDRSLTLARRSRPNLSSSWR
jgi:hypothetical protein